MMKRRNMAALMGMLVLGGLVLGCSSHPRKNTPTISYYTCPMHHQVQSDTPGNCPICGMKLVPVYLHHETPSEQHPASQFRLLPEQQHLMGLTTAVAVKKTVTKDLRTVGWVAFDQELLVAEREFIDIAAHAPILKSAAVQRLNLLGLDENEIKQLEKQGHEDESLVVSRPGHPVWVYATLYQEEEEQVHKGQSATIVLPKQNDLSFEGTVISLDPNINSATRALRARILVPKAGGKLKPETYVNVMLHVNLGPQLVIPRSAVVDTGRRTFVFVVHDGEYVEPRDITVSTETEQDVVVKTGLSEGETVASNATFLLDSESELRSVVPGIQDHQHHHH